VTDLYPSCGYFIPLIRLNLPKKVLFKPCTQVPLGMSKYYII
jgi:hypothetical protein